MDEKTMVNDVLNNVKLSLIKYQEIITETENMSLRQLIQQIRNADESFEYELIKIAQVKGYYDSSILANNTEVQDIKNQII